MKKINLLSEFISFLHQSCKPQKEMYQSNKIKCLISIFIMLSFFYSTSYANDCIFFVNGNQLVPSEQEKDISVKKEILTISLQDNGFTKVNVYYEFNNIATKTKSVLMGFEASCPYNANCEFNPKGIHPFISNFSVNMNGNVLPFSNAVVESEIPNGFNSLDLNTWKAEGEEFEESDGRVLQNGKDTKSYSYAYYFKANFEPGINRILHSYDYKTSYGVAQAFIIDYKLTPAIRWANKQIDDFTLVVRADNTAKHFRINYDVFKDKEFELVEGTGKCRKIKHYEEDWLEFSLRNGVYKWHTENFKPKGELGIYSCENLYWNSDTIKLGSTYDRNPNFMWIFPISTDFDLKVAHNLPYAQRGYVFEDSELKTYFEQFWWYMPNPDYKANTEDFTEKDFEYLKMEKTKEEDK